MDSTEFYEQLDTLYATGSRRAVEQFLQDMSCADLSEQMYIAVMNEKGSFYRGASNYEKSLDAFENAVSAIARVMGETSVEYATAIMNMAGTYRLMGSTDKALSLFQEAKWIYTAQPDSNPYELASVWNNMALAYQDKGDLAYASDCIAEALAVLEEIDRGGALKAITLNNLASLQYRAEKYDEAKASVNLALEIFEAPENMGNSHYAAAINMMASLYYREESYEAALSSFKKALMLTESSFGRNIEYAIGCRSVAQVLERQGNYNNALDYIRTAACIFERVYGAGHQYTRAARQKLSELCALCHESQR